MCKVRSEFREIHITVLLLKAVRHVTQYMKTDADTKYLGSKTNFYYLGYRPIHRKREMLTCYKSAEMN